MTASVLLGIDAGIARITLNRPASLNAFDADMAHAWVAAVTDALAHPETRAIIIAAEGRAFCAGGDVRAMAEMPDREDALTSLAEVINVGLAALVESSIPVVAAAHGTTAGGGLGVLLASDYAVVGESSRVGALYAGVGLTPDLSVTALLARAVGERRALQLTLQDRLLPAKEAQEWGLVAEVVADDAVLERAETIARHWVDGAAYAYGQAKRLIRSQPSRSFREQLAEEARTIGATSVTAEAEKRIQAFAAR
ncbi:2-(1,2-epoxy-1,2-dihydrophenyl)acetyl-CoA isomerase [Leucobacter exalbidus]|uniref:2-(1,2-epoxy-1,2-dihydrophenyl)acetyl-CoA isomerase n=1 Tax=Leucobacter exalbidus TaxID=662960 RepID=A0A940PXJ2_9MICO|nr:enoyl-CoA hydratase/isomerase family protein [Leucobacter exalbidus]MBP1326006.1 2-(1,2-epoxy-1,2-dihydrophenyl)acetyl-CoA isomerase [Leucobacter exalbidus]